MRESRGVRDSHPAPRRAGRWLSFLAIPICLAAPALSRAAITIGPGGGIGTDSSGASFNEEFMDWTAGDLKALDKCGALWDARYNFSDGYDDSRDIIAFYFRDEGDTVYFRLDFFNLALGAENGNLDFYIAIDCAPGAGQEWMPDFCDVRGDPGHPWDLCVSVYDTQNFNIYDSAFGTAANAHYRGAYYRSDLDAVELGLARQALLDAGWDGARPLYFQVFTTKDGTASGPGEVPDHSDVADDIMDDDRGYSDGYLNGVISSQAAPGRALYASIAHGNQSINAAAAIRSHVFDPNTQNKTGFVRTLDTHEIFRVPLNIHMSGSLIAALQWAAAPEGAADLSDGPAFLQRVARMLDPARTTPASALIGGVFAEHILPYFEGEVNRLSIELFDEIAFRYFGLRAAQMKVMHTPERVIRSQATGLAPLTGLTFADIEASDYTATVLDEVTHYHWWFDAQETRWSGAGGGYEAPAHHKIHKINGVYCFLINDREDQSKFSNDDGGLALDTRYTLLEKAMRAGDQAFLTLVFDDWEALAGKSFDSGSGQSSENNNQGQYQRTIRWIANHPWIEVVTLAEVLDRATNPQNPRYDSRWVIDHGSGLNSLTLQTYEWLKHASENSYHFWYYNQDAGNPGNEQSFYDLVPVILGPQGDYRARGATPANDGPPLPGGKKHGDLNTPGTLLHDAWADLSAAPDNELRRLGEFAFCSMIYETAWHEEDNNDYHSHNYQQWTSPDTTWDGVNTWALQLNNHARDAGKLAEAARWLQAVRSGAQGAATAAQALDLDQDGENEYILKNNRVWACFERYGGRLVFAAHYDPVSDAAQAVIGAPYSNPAAPGEEEFANASANRCSAFKEMNDGAFADRVYNAAPGADFITFSTTAPQGSVTKKILLEAGAPRLRAEYSETVSGPLHIRIGASPDALDLLFTGRAELRAESASGAYTVRNTNGARVRVTLPAGVSRNAAPSWAGFQNRNLAMTEEIEISGDGVFAFELDFGDPAPGPSSSLFVLY